MPKNINSASRLVALLQSIPGYADDTQTLEVWAMLFDVGELNPNKKAAVVGERLSAMYRELELIREQMQKANFSEDLLRIISFEIGTRAFLDAASGPMESGSPIPDP